MAEGWDEVWEFDPEPFALEAGAGFFLCTVFFSGSVSSTMTFLGGGGAAACCRL